MFTLSGAINVVLFLASQSELLLFAPPVVEPEIMPMQSTSPSPDPVNQSLQLSAVDLANDLEEQPPSQPPEGSGAVQSGDNFVPDLGGIV